LIDARVLMSYQTLKQKIAKKKEETDESEQQNFLYHIAMLVLSISIILWVLNNF